MNDWLFRIALAALALMASLPFLVPLHTTPIPSFWSEWLAAALGLTAAGALIGARRLPLPGAALLAMTLAGIALAQKVLGLAPVPQLAALFALYLVWAAMLACTGRLLAETVGTTHVVQVLASAILTGSLLAALLGLAQPWLALHGWTGYSLRGGGPLNQANHMSVYVWLGSASALYLRVTQRISKVVFWTAAAALVLAAVLVGQRSSFLYAIALLAVAAWLWRGAETDALDGRPLAFGIGFMFIGLQPLTALIPVEGGVSAAPPAMRAMQQLEGPSIRLQLLRLGYHAVGESPLTGAGIGSYPGLAYAYADAIAPDDNPGPAEHAHNLLVDLGVELGLPAALLVLRAALLWLRRLPHCAPSTEAGWAAAMIGMLALHSMIEYPLWHAYFLGLVAVIAGAFGRSRQVGTRLSAVALTMGLIAYGSWALTDLRRDYTRLELALRRGVSKPASEAALLAIPKDSPLTPWVQTTACVVLDPDEVALDDGLVVCEAAMKFAPTPEAGANMTALLSRAGKEDEAADLLRRIGRLSATSSSR